MRISKARNTTPDSTPPSDHGIREEAASRGENERYVWTSLVPRLIHPTKLAIVEALIEAGKPLSAEDLISRLTTGGDPELLRDHAKCMVEVGALEVTSIQEAGDEVRLYFFPHPE